MEWWEILLVVIASFLLLIIIYSYLSRYIMGPSAAERANEYIYKKWNEQASSPDFDGRINFGELPHPGIVTQP